MSTFPYKNPISSEQLNGIQSVERSEVFGTNFSVLSVGGYMEVFNLSDLNYTINGLGPIEYSGNSIPIDFLKGTGAPWSPDVLTLNSDNISSGRRRLGMLVYVYEVDQVYQYRIDNYESLWTAATASPGTVVISDFGTTVYNSSVDGQNFINSWTASTIEDVSGYTHSTAVWKKYTISGANLSELYLPLSGGTVSGNTYFTSGLTATTISATTYQNLPTDIRTTGATYSNNNFIFTNNTGGTYSVSFNTVTGLTANTISATTYYNLPVSAVTSGTGISASTSNGTVTITNTSPDQTVTISGGTGITTGGTYPNFTLVNSSPDQTVTISGGTGITTGGTYPNFTLVNSSPDQTVTITGGTNIQIDGTYPNFGVNYTGQTSFPYLPLSGGTVTGATNFTGGLSANTISATTIYANGGNVVTKISSGIDSTGNTTTGSYQLVQSVLIPANTITTGDVVLFKARYRKVGANAAANYRITVNTTLNLTGAQIVGQFNSGLTILYLELSRTAAVKGGTTEVFNTSVTNVQDDVTQSTIAVTNLTIDWTINQYVMYSILNSSASDTTFVSYYSITEI